MPVTLFDTMLDELLKEDGAAGAQRASARTEKELLHYLQLSVRDSAELKPSIGPEPVALAAWRLTDDARDTG